MGISNDFATKNRYQFLDTQVISYAFKGIADTTTLRGSAISSIVASEFLLMQGDDPKKANYYIPFPLSNMSSYKGPFPVVHAKGLGFVKGPRRLPSPLTKPSIDSIMMEFGGEHETIVEYSHQALANVINNQGFDVFCACIEQLDKKRQKIVKKRCRFLLDHELLCISLNKDILDLAYLLLHEFKERHNVKGNFRNSWNDLLILATALLYGTGLVTKDNELSRFMAERHAFSIKHQNQFVHLSFSEIEVPIRRVSRESKKYINRSWQAEFYH